MSRQGVASGVHVGFAADRFGSQRTDAGCSYDLTARGSALFTSKLDDLTTLQLDFKIGALTPGDVGVTEISKAGLHLGILSMCGVFRS